MTGIHNVFPADIIDSNDPISKKKLLKGEGQYSLLKMLFGFDFDGKRKTMWLDEEKRAKLLTILHSWLRAGSLNRGIPFGEFKSAIAKLQHAFTALPGGWGLLSPCNCLLKNGHQWITSIATIPFIRQYQTAKQFYKNPRVGQRTAAN